MAQTVSRQLPIAEFDIRPVHVKFVVDKAELVQVSLRVLEFAPVSIILPMQHNHSLIYHRR